MKHKKKVFLAGTAFLAGLLICFAEEPPASDSHPGQMRKERYGKRLASELGLSDETAAELKQNMQDTRVKMKKLKSERDTAKAKLEQLFQADLVDESALLKATDKLAEANANIIKTRIKARLNTLKLLTPEQRKRMKKLRKTARNRHMQRMKESHTERSKRRGLKQPQQCQQKNDKQ